MENIGIKLSLVIVLCSIPVILFKLFPNILIKFNNTNVNSIIYTAYIILGCLFIAIFV
ncbi:TPA: hypothetical protein ACS7ZV_003560 [Providencia alcalifaciens]